MLTIVSCVSPADNTRADIKDSLRVQIDPAQLAKNDAEYLFREINRLHPEFAKSTKVTRDSSKKGKGRHRGPPLAPIASHHGIAESADSATDSDESSAEGGDDDDNDDDDGDDDDADADDSQSDEDVILSNFNLFSSSIYVALTNMDIKKGGHSDEGDFRITPPAKQPY